MGYYRIYIIEYYQKHIHISKQSRYKFLAIPNGIYIKRFSTVTIVFSPICKPAQQGTHTPLYNALHYTCITQHITQSTIIW